ncbi:DUF488 domain-containing protein [Candidatus Bathyarchaeota archaeon]|nr:MAG: DUF488 domain-containing protein [Candidatus Bathyarchaeota archaeon]
MHFFTIGHSNRSLSEFISLLKRYNIEILIDVRRWPTSKKYPHFNYDVLKEELEREGIRYLWLGKELGGYRRAGLGDESPNKAWSSLGFRNYADHTLSEEFKNGINRILRYAARWNVAYMCSEKFYWRCHRRIISDYLVAKGHQVTHIIDLRKTRKHKLTRFARIVDGRLIYPETNCRTLD